MNDLGVRHGLADGPTRSEHDLHRLGLGGDVLSTDLKSVLAIALVVR